MRFENKVAVVTGAASGMGRALAVQLASLGARGVAICDVVLPALEETAAQCRKAATHKGFKVTTARVDVSSREQMEQWRDAVVLDFGVVDALFNNAGINAVGRMVHAPGTSKEEMDKFEQMWDRCFAIDFFGVLNGCRAFVPVMVAKSKEGCVVNTASVNAFWTWPEHSAYTAAKHAVKGLTESLHIEMQLKAPHIKVACLFPGGVRTGIAAGTLSHNKSGIDTVAGLFEQVADLSSEQAAEWILDAVARGRHRILVGYDAWFLDKMVRFGPETVYAFYESLGRSGFVSDPTDVTSNKGKLGLVAGAKFLYNGGWFMLPFLAPIPLFKLRHSTAGQLALGGLAAATAVGVGKLGAKL